MPGLSFQQRPDELAEEFANRVLDELVALRGARSVPGVGELPALTNAEALALLASTRAAAGLGRNYGVAIRVPYWPEAWYAALGYEKTGDKFKNTDPAWMGAPARDELLEATALAVRGTCAELASAGVDSLLFLQLDTSKARIKRAAEDAWRALQSERASGTESKLPSKPGTLPLPIPGIPLPMPPGVPPVTTPPVTIPIPSPPGVSRGGSAWLLWVAIAAMLYLGRRR